MRAAKRKVRQPLRKAFRKIHDLAGEECARGGRSDMLAKHHTAGADASMVLEVVFALHDLASK